MNKLYRFRLNPNGEDRFLEAISKGFICLGWPLTGCLKGFDKEQLKTTINESYPNENYTSQQLGMAAGYFVRMLSLQKDDYVLIAAPKRQLLIARVTREYYYDGSYANKHMSHQVGIEPIKYVSMDSLSDSLKNTLDAVNSVVWVQSVEQVNEVSELIEFDDFEICEAVSREILYQDNSKKISITLTGNVTKSDLLSVVQKINFVK